MYVCMYVLVMGQIFFAFNFERDLVAAHKRESEWWIILQGMNSLMSVESLKTYDWISSFNPFSHL